MRNVSRGILAFTLVALLATPALAQRRRGGGGMGAPPGAQGLALWAAFDRNFDSLTTALAMDQDQKDALDGAMAMMRMDHGPELAEITKLQNEMRELRSSGQMNRETMMETMGRYRESLEPFAPVLDEFAVEVQKILNDDQEKQLQDAMQRAMGGRRPGGQ